MNLGVCMLFFHQGELLYHRPPSAAGKTALSVPSMFLPDGETPQAAALRLLKVATGLTPQAISSVGMIFFRKPDLVDVNVSVWAYRDESPTRPEARDGQYIWLPVEPEFDPAVPELDRHWLPHVLRHVHFQFRVEYDLDGRVDHVMIHPKRSSVSPDRPASTEPLGLHV